MDKRIEKLIFLLRKKRLYLSAAESCSGGYLSYLLTKIAGSSQVFKGSIVVYSLEAKRKFFNIPYTILKDTQGVSEKIAITLAKKVRSLFNSDIGVSLVGFAGPKARKGIKVGTVFISIAYKGTFWVERIVIKGNRDRIRKKACLYLIDKVYQRVKI